MSYSDLDLYQTLNVKKDAKDAEIRKSYYKLALKYHPDRSSSDEASNEEFQKIGFAYSILSDKKKREVYDRTGSTEYEEISDISEFVDLLFARVTKEDIAAFEKTYKQSKEEEQDLINLYTLHKGDMLYVIENLLFGSLDDEKRYRAFLDPLIESGELKTFRKYSSSDKVRKAKMRKRAEEEAIEAEKLAKELGLYEDRGKSILPSKQKHRQQMDSLADRLAQKYGKEKKRKSTEPSEEDFARMTARKKKVNEFEVTPL